MALMSARFFGEPTRRAARHGRHRHQRQDHDRPPAGRAVRGGRPAAGPPGHGGQSHRRGRARREAHHRRFDRAAAHVPGDGRRRRPVMRHGGLVARSRARAHDRRRVRVGHLHEPVARPPRLSRDLRRLLRREALAVFARRAAPGRRDRGGQRRRRVRSPSDRRLPRALRRRPVDLRPRRRGARRTGRGRLPRGRPGADAPSAPPSRSSRRASACARPCRSRRRPGSTWPTPWPPRPSRWPWACRSRPCAGGWPALAGVPGRVEPVRAGQPFSRAGRLLAHARLAGRRAARRAARHGRTSAHRVRLRRRSRPRQAAADGRGRRRSRRPRRGDLGQPAQRGPAGDHRRGAVGHPGGRSRARRGRARPSRGHPPGAARGARRRRPGDRRQGPRDLPDPGGRDDLLRRSRGGRRGARRAGLRARGRPTLGRRPDDRRGAS